MASVARVTVDPGSGDGRCVRIGGDRRHVRSRPLRILLALLGLVALSLIALVLRAERADAAACDPEVVTHTFTGGAGSGSWHSAGNWSTGTVPGTTDQLDQVCIPADRSVAYTTGASTIGGMQVDGQLSISGGSLQLAGAGASEVAGTLGLSGSATLGGSASLTIPAGGTFSWTSGIHTGAGTTTVASGASLNLVGANQAKSLTGGRRLRNEGTTVHSGGQLQLLDGGTVFENTGRFEMAGDLSVVMSGGSPVPSFANRGGSFTKTAGASGGIIQGQFSNGGSVEVGVGSLNISGGGATHGGTFSVLAGTTLQFSTGTHTVDGSLSGGGTLRTVSGHVTVNGTYGVATTTLPSGSLTLNTPSTVPTVNLSGSATLGGSGALTIPAGGTFSWTSGIHSGAATTTISKGATLNLVGANQTKSLGGGRRISNEGSTVHAGGGLQLFNDGTTFDNAGSYEMTADVSLLMSGGAPAPVFTNQAGASFTKAGGPATSNVFGLFDNHGTVEVRSGTLQLPASFPAYDAATRSLRRGNYVVLTTLRLGGADVTTLAADVTLDGAAARILDSSGQDALRALATVEPAASLTVRNGKALTSSTALANAGTVTVGAASTLISTGAYTQTQGTTSVADPTARLMATGAAVDVQGGTLQGVGAVGPALRGAGVVRPGLSPGTLSVDGSYAQPASGTLEVDVAASSADQLSVSGAASVGGTLNIVTEPGFSPTPGTEYRVLAAGSRTGEFAVLVGDELDGALYYDVDYRDDGVVLVVRQRTVSAPDAGVVEGTGSSSTGEVWVTISRRSQQEVRVGYSTEDGTATAGQDHTASSGTLVFAPGEVTKPVPVQVTGDALHERDEVLSFVLTEPYRAVLDRDRAAVTIVDDDPPPAISITDITITEGTGGTTTAAFTVSLSSPSGLPASVDYATIPGTATAPADYTATSGTVDFLPGETSKTVSASVSTDSDDEPDEAFEVVLTNPVDATIADATGVATILDDDEVVVNPAVDLSVALTGSPDPVVAGARLTLTATVSNEGSEPATGVVLASALPSTVTFDSVTTDRGTCAYARRTKTVTCTIGALAAGEDATVTIAVDVKRNATSVSGTVRVHATEGELSTGNNTATNVTPVVKR